MLVKIARCENPILWYNQFIGETFECTEPDTPDAYWVIIPDADGMLGWVYKKDCLEVIPYNNKDKDTNEY